MAVYVDELTDYGDRVKGRARRYGTVWCHMTADSRDELILMAYRIKLSTRWIQHDDDDALRHFDLIPSKRSLALRQGAIEITNRQAGEMVLAIRKRQRVSA